MKAQPLDNTFMSESGLYTFIKNELAQGKSKDEIARMLIENGGWTQADLVPIFSNIEKGIQPAPYIPKTLRPASVGRIISTCIVTIVIILIIVGGYYLYQEWRGNQYRKEISLVIDKSITANQHLGDAINNSVDEDEFVDKCFDLEKEYEAVSKETALISAPYKYKKAHDQISEGMDTYSTAVSKICKAVSIRSAPDLFSNIALYNKGSTLIKAGTAEVGIKTEIGAISKPGV
jgi:hypothetical protein